MACDASPVTMFPNLPKHFSEFRKLSEETFFSPKLGENLFSVVTSMFSNLLEYLFSESWVFFWISSPKVGRD